MSSASVKGSPICSATVWPFMSSKARLTESRLTSTPNRKAQSGLSAYTTGRRPPEVSSFPHSWATPASISSPMIFVTVGMLNSVMRPSSRMVRSPSISRRTTRRFSRSMRKARRGSESCVFSMSAKVIRVFSSVYAPRRYGIRAKSPRTHRSFFYTRRCGRSSGRLAGQTLGPSYTSIT